MINPAVDALAPLVGTATGCALLGRARASHYRAKRPPVLGPKPRRPAAANALTDVERAQVLKALTSERFVDKSVAQAWATLLDEGTYLCSRSSMHRILRANHAAGERRSHAAHPARVVPELLATKAGQVWSWDITKLRGPQRGVYFDLYVVLDIFSRYVVGWTVAAREDSQVAKELLEQAMGIHGVPQVVHADRGTSMTSKPVAQLLVDLGVTRSHSRPHVSNDNPYSESQFKTMKYAPGLSRAVRLPGRRPRLRRGVLRLLQPRAPPLRDRVAHPRLGPPRHPPPRPRPAPADPRHHLRRPPRNGSATADPGPQESRPRPGSTSPHAKHSYKARNPPLSHPT